MEALPYPRKRPFYVFHLLINITTLEAPEIEISVNSCLTLKIRHLCPFRFNFLMIQQTAHATKYPAVNVGDNDQWYNTIKVKKPLSSFISY